MNLKMIDAYTDIPQELCLNGCVQTSVSVPAAVPLQLVPAGTHYSLTALEVTTDAPAASPVLVQVLVAGVAVYSALIHSLAPLRWTNRFVSIEASEGQQVSLQFGRSSAIQNVAYNVAQINS